MALTINTNVASLNAQRNLSSSSMDLATSLQRLSSGLRINSAKDDAAGLAISSRMTTQINGMNVAMRNANDGVSLAQTAEGSLASVGDALQRIRELAVQSVNATNSDSDRAALDTEAQQLKSEINRVATQTNFNGVKLLDGSFANQTFQVGANSGETIDVASVANAQSTALGTTDLATTTYTTTGGAISTFAALGAGDVIINGEDIGAVAAGTDAATQATNVIAAINGNANLAAAGITAAGDETGIILTSTDVAITAALSGAATGTNTGLDALTEVQTAGAAVTVVGFDTLDLTTAAGADDAIQFMDSALEAVNTARADLGAIQSRFESVVSNLAINSENISAARGRILDADFAAETASLTRNQILQQAGTAMLAQANQIPQNVLSLLRW